MHVPEEVGRSRRPHRSSNCEFQSCQSTGRPILLEIGDPDHRAYTLDKKEVLFCWSLSRLASLIR